MRFPEIPRNINLFSIKRPEKKLPTIDAGKQLSSQEVLEAQPKPAAEGVHVEKGPPTNHEIGVFYSGYPVSW